MLRKQFKALANPARVEILDLLSDSKSENSKSERPKELSVQKIVESVALSPSTISHHLNVLKEADLVTSRKDKQWIYYSLNKATIATIKDFFDRF